MQLEKSFQISTEAQIQALIESLRASANYAVSQLAALPKRSDGLSALVALKFNAIGCDPLKLERPLNLIEQLNQTFTYLATFRAVNLLLTLHPEFVPFRVNLGTRSGADIESNNKGDLAAEVFAAVNPSNNLKLVKDTQKVLATGARHRYVFFMCPGFVVGRQEKLESRAGVQVWAVAGES